MKKILFLTLCIVYCVSSFDIIAQNREFRATWLTTVWGIDWPTTQISPTASIETKSKHRAQQQKELCIILDSLKEANMNAVFFQVRGMSDAMYNSKYENWSRCLTGMRGCDPGYDPLEFAIQEAHKRGIELHAWLNPYRYSSSTDTYSKLDNDYAVQHPDWILNYGDGTTILDPGLPEVRQRIQEIIADIVTRYDVDGIVFDDYFYAYGGTSNTLDKSTQDKYRPEGMDLGDWRRDNVNMMIKDVYDTIQIIKPYVKFGVSPFGTWTTDKSVADKHGLTLPGGVANTGNMYASIYCDPIAWLEQGTIDYVSPQLYWTTTSAYPFGILSNWWSEISSRFGRHFYASHSVSALEGSASPAPQRRGFSNIEAIALLNDTDFVANTSYIHLSSQQKRAFKQGEIGAQINYNRMYDVNDAPGSVLYNTNKTVDTKNFIQYLKRRVYTTKILTPHINWKDASVPASPIDFKKIENVLSWKLESNLYRTAVYAIPDDYVGDDKYSPMTLLELVFDSTTYEIPKEYLNGYSFAITAVNRYGAESAPIKLDSSITTILAPELIYPDNGAVVLMPCLFKWEKSTADWAKYQWQISTDAQFENMAAMRTVFVNEFNTSVMYNIVDGNTYYWRVRTIEEGGASEWSETRKFTSKLFGFNSPENNSAEHVLTPTFVWDDVSMYGEPTYKFELATANTFLGYEVYSIVTDKNQVTIPEGLLKYSTTYYARVSVSAGDVSAVSPVFTIITQDIYMPTPMIISPINGEEIIGSDVLIKWEQQPANGFRLELSKSNKFPARSLIIKNLDGYTFEHEFVDLDYGTYFVRVKANKPYNTSTSYSDTISFTLIPDGTLIDNVDFNEIKLVNIDENTIALFVDLDKISVDKISIFSISGQKMYDVETICYGNNGSIMLSISDLSKGVYLVEIYYKIGKKVLKFQK